MPRPKNLYATEATKVYFTPENAAALRLACFSPLRGKTQYGELSRIVNEAVSQYFARDIKTETKEIPDVQP